MHQVIWHALRVSTVPGEADPIAAAGSCTAESAALVALAVVAVILIGKALVAYAISRAFDFRPQTALTVSASLAQIDEFSFILASLETSLGVLPT